MPSAADREKPGSPSKEQGRSYLTGWVVAIWGGPARLRNFLRTSGYAHAALRIIFGLRGLRQHADYRGWVRRYDEASAKHIEMLRRRGESGGADVHFAIGVIASPVDPGSTDGTIASLRAQTYRCWSLQLDPDAPRSVPSTTGPSNNDAEHRFHVTLHAGDVLAPWALHLAMSEIVADPDLELIYTDTDEINEQGRRSRPWFKPSYNRELLLEQDFTAGLRMVRDSLLNALRGDEANTLVRPLSHGDVLRLTELTQPTRIRHIPHVLLHVPQHTSPDPPKTETAPLREAALAVQAHLDRTRSAGVVSVIAETSGPRLQVSWPVPSPMPGVTVIVPTRDSPELLRVCVDGLLQDTSYENLRIVIADNGTTDPDALELLRRYNLHDGVEVLALPGPFNYSGINNQAASDVDTPFLLLLNNDIEVIHSDWLTQMVGLAHEPGVGAVGAKLLYPDDTIQHAGVVLGIRPRLGVSGVAGHIFKRVKGDEVGYFERLVHTQEVSAVTGACLLTRTEVFHGLGGLNSSDLAVAFNDVDYCLRVRAEGLRVIWTPLAELYHHESVSRGDDESGEAAVRFSGEAAWMRERWGASLIDDDPFYNPNLTLDRTDLMLAYPPRVARPWTIAPG